VWWTQLIANAAMHNFIQPLAIRGQSDIQTNKADVLDHTMPNRKAKAIAKRRNKMALVNLKMTALDRLASTTNDQELD
jgi:hypothetical protein